MRRRVEPEILDRLPVDDARAVRSRKDLRRINALMGNFSWILGALRGLPRRPREVVEIGAGDGGLLERLGGLADEVAGVDLVPRPAGLHPRVGWHQGDVFEVVKGGDVLVANLFLHHFEDEQLAALGELAQQFHIVCVSEPRRSRLALFGGCALFPFVNDVTRHDMPVSIRAGFRRGELPALLGLVPGWRVVEEETWRGACRMLAWKE